MLIFGEVKSNFILLYRNQKILYNKNLEKS